MGHPNSEPPSPSCCLGILAELREAAGRNLAGTKTATPGYPQGDPHHHHGGDIKAAHPVSPVPLALRTQAEVPPCAHAALTGIPGCVPQLC